MEEETTMVTTEQADGVKNDGELSNSGPSKRGRGRPQGSKKLKVCVTDVNLTKLVSGISNGGAIQRQRGRGRPSLSSRKETVQEGSRDDHDNSVQTPSRTGSPKGLKEETSNGGSPTREIAPKKRGRPKKSLSQSAPKKAAAEDLPNGGSSTPKVGRGRPKGSTKRKSESLKVGAEDVGSPATPRKRGRPKGTTNKKRRLEVEVEVSSEEEADTDESSPPRTSRSSRKVKNASNGVSKGRGRPRKYFDNKKINQKLLADGSGQKKKKGRGRPKGSLNKKHPAFKPAQHGTVSRPQKVHVSPPKERRGRPKKNKPAKRGRPRKHPLPAPGDRKKKPKVWKPLGRPRKYPRPDPPEGATDIPPRKVGRPRKGRSKRGAHLRKNNPPSPSSASNANDGPPRKRGRPPGSAKSAGKSADKSADATPRKRGRPRSAVNKNKADEEPQPDGALSNHSTEESDASPTLLLEGGPVEEDMEDDTQNTDPAVADAEETLIEQDATVEVSNQA